MSTRSIRLPNGITLAVQNIGPDEGQPVILGHGGGQTRHAWAKTVRVLAEAGWLAIVYDHRGHGDSGRANDGDYRFPRFGEDLVQLVEALNLKQKPVIVGASLGGLSALLAEREKPGLCAAIMLVDIIPAMDASGVDRIQGFMRAKLDEGFADLEEAAAAIAAYLPHRKRLPTPDGLRKNLRKGTDGRWRWHWDPAFVRGPLNINVDGEQTMRLLDEHAAHYGCPVRLIRGGSSDLVDRARAEAFVSRLADGAMADVGKAGHMVAGDRNDAFSETLVAMLGTLN